MKEPSSEDPSFAGERGGDAGDPAAEILAFIQRSLDGNPEGFDALALRLFAWQQAHNPVLSALLAGRSPAHVADIPAVPVSLFQDLDIASFSLDLPHLVFRTSGTSSAGRRRGAHHLPDSRLYDAASIGFFRHLFPDAPARVLSLCPAGGGESSLGHMVDQLGAEVVHAFDGGTSGGGVDVALAWRTLLDGTPCLLAATAFALDVLLSGSGASATLDARSLVMVTGGFKGRHTRLDADGLYAEIERLGTPRVVGEYGMTELSSQLWTRPVAAGERPGPYRPPPWLRVTTVDPATGAPVAGEGQLRFVDLANVGSVLAIETQDLGRVDVDGVTLLGRLPGAEVRGCSLSVEELGR